jgi:hypothetical protein
MKSETHYRQLTRTENGLMQRLMVGEFPGKDQITRQLANCQARTIDEEGSLEIKVDRAAVAAPVKKRIPVEAEGVDADGVLIHMLLHTGEGFVKELEIYKEDGSAIRRMPHPEEFEVIVLPS